MEEHASARKIFCTGLAPFLFGMQRKARYNGRMSDGMAQQPDTDLELQIDVAKVGKYAVLESGDTVELIERPHGGLSVVMVDGQRSGRSAKAISNIVARKAISLLADGVRDGAAARAAHDYLRTLRSGQVSATLNIVSIDLSTRTIVVSRNSHCPVIVVDGGSELRLLDEPSEAIGIHARTRPVIAELPIGLGTTLVVYTDGVQSAGEQYGRPFDAPAFVREYLCAGQKDESGATGLADALLARAVALDHGRPADDVSVVVVSVAARGHVPVAGMRRVAVRFPI
jgi:serine phosphatase RsbU (regulator of sigma subunit)